jgi:methionine-rich copper-binding protein CopC
MSVITRSPLVSSNAVFSAALLVLASLLALITPTQGWAHTSLTTSAPANGQPVTSVSQLTLEFGAPLRLMRVSLKNAAGQEVALNFKRSPTAQARFVVPTNAPLAPASYQVFWMGMADDGHKIEGDFGFIVNPLAVAVTAEPATVTAMAMFSGLEHPAAPTVLEFHAALKAGDKQAVVRLLASDVVIFEGGGVERYRNEYQSHHMAADMAYLQHMSTTRVEHHVRGQGDSAV